MNVNTAQAGHIEYRFRQNEAVSHNYHHVSVQVCH
ncbi:Uncharacterised protein [Enterobacter cloacae]|nr:Uncharacterised protein [Enterobacter cloacae]